MQRRAADPWLTDEQTSALDAFVGIGAAHSPQDALDHAVALASRLIDATVAIACWTTEDMAAALVAAVGTVGGDAAQQAMAVLGDTGSVVRTVVEPDAGLLPADGDETAAVLGVRLERAGTGGLLLARPLTAGRFSAAEERILTALTHQTALALTSLGFAGERRRLQEALHHAERLKTEFVAMTSHELRTPLTSIRAATSMIRSYWDTIAQDRKLRLLEVIEDQAQRLSRMVENILAAANLEAGVVLPRVATIDLAAAADDVARDFAVELEIEVDCERPLMADADPDHVRQILVNFVGNSLKYGEPPVVVRGRRVADGLELRVIDAGPGVPEDFVPRLFDRFTQATRGASRHASGSGLGLSIVKGLAEASGGAVRYEPRAPRGASFVLKLPAVPEPPQGPG